MNDLCYSVPSRCCQPSLGGNLLVRSPQVILLLFLSLFSKMTPLSSRVMACICRLVSCYSISKLQICFSHAHFRVFFFKCPPSISIIICPNCEINKTQVQFCAQKNYLPVGVVAIFPFFSKLFLMLDFPKKQVSPFVTLI